MCGIVGATTRREALPILLAGLDRLEYRGYDSAGVAVQHPANQGIERVRCQGKVADLRQVLATQSLEGRTGIAHTRWATHGVPSETNAHPHLSNGTICLVHNGIIENYEALRTDLQTHGFVFETETDSETIAHLIAHHYQQTENLVEAVALARQQLDGAYAIAVMAHDDPGRIVAARGGCPLVIGIGMGENFVASDVLALRPVTDRFIFLEEGDLVELTTDRVLVRDLDGDFVDRIEERVDGVGDEIDKKGYRHFMQKEIDEQPGVIRHTVAEKVGRNRILEHAFGVQAPALFDDVESVSIVGCGTAYYAACVAKYWIEDIVKVPCTAEIASEFRYRNMVVREKALFLSMSQSGESADTIAALRVAKERGFKHTMVISNVANSTLVRESELPVLMQAGVEVSVASTKAFTAMLLNLLLFALVLGRRTGSSRELESEIVEVLRELPVAIEQALALNERIRRMAEDFLHKNHVLFLGRGPQYPVALEGALKMKELSYIHAEGYPAGELKHGPLALVDDDMPIVAVAPSNELLEKVQSNLEEVRARGGRLYVFADADAGFSEKDGVTVIEVPKVHPLLAPIVYVVPLQLLAYHVAVQKGTDIDQPRNLAKSVTVE